MISVSIDPNIRACCPNAVLGLLQCHVSVHPADDTLLALLNEKIAALAETELSQANKREFIQSTRRAYKALGKDPNRYRSSAEAMCRRIAKERGLYYINNVVDINNYLSISCGYSMGTYDLEQIRGNLVWKRAPEDCVYQGIGKDLIHIGCLPVLFDADGPFGNPTSDSTRTMVTESTKEILMVFYTFQNGQELDQLLELAANLLTAHAQATNIETQILA